MSDRLVIRNGIVLTLNDADDVLFGGTVVIDGDRITAVAGSDEAIDALRRDGDRRGGQGRDARPDRSALPHGARQGVERSPPAVGVPADVLVSDDPGARPGERVLGGACELRRVDSLRGDDGQRHVPPARGAWRTPPRRSASGRCCPTTSRPTSTTSTRSRTTRARSAPSTGPPTDGSRCSSGSSGCRSPPRSCCGTPARSPTSSAPGSTSTSTSRSARSRSPRRCSAAARPRSPTTTGSSAPTASRRTACGSQTPRSR